MGSRRFYYVAEREILMDCFSEPGYLSWEEERHFEASEHPSKEVLCLCTVEGTIDADISLVAPGSAMPLVYPYFSSSSDS